MGDAPRRGWYKPWSTSRFWQRLQPWLRMTLRRSPRTIPPRGGRSVLRSCRRSTLLAQVLIGQAVTRALRAVYLPWLDAGAVALQKLVAGGKVPFAEPKKPPTPPARAVLLFVDGLRMDLAQQLAVMFRAKGASVARGFVWSGFPTVTGTCKPLASPAAGLLEEARGWCRAFRGSR